MAEQKTKTPLRTLFNNAETVLGRPHYQDRKIKIENVRLQAGFGKDVLRVDAEAFGTSKYTLTINFYGIKSYDEPTGSAKIPVKMGPNKTKYVGKVFINSTPVRVFCSCTWFRFASEWYLKKDGSLMPARKPRPYKKVPGSKRPSINPKKLPCVCKHLYQLALELQNRGLLVNR